MATYSFVATFTVVLSTYDNDILYLPILVGLCLKSFGYIVRSPHIKVLGTVMLVGTMLVALYRAVLCGYNPMLFLLTYAVSVFADLLIGSLDEVHRKYTTAVEDKAEAVKNVYEMMLGIVSSTVKSKLEDMQVLVTEEYRNNQFLFLMTLSRYTGNINQVLDSSYFSSRSREPLQQVLSKELSKEYPMPVSVDYRGMSVITSVGYHSLYLSTVLNGIMFGACEIAEHSGVEILHVSVNIGPYGAVLEDNSGVAPHKVRMVGRDKFLRTVSDPAVQKLFGLSIHVEPTHNGYRYIITLFG